LIYLPGDPGIIWLLSQFIIPVIKKLSGDSIAAMLLFIAAKMIAIAQSVLTFAPALFEIAQPILGFAE
jgi:hypothetical protein